MARNGPKLRRKLTLLHRPQVASNAAPASQNARDLYAVLPRKRDHPVLPTLALLLPELGPLLLTYLYPPIPSFP